jgi:hypothetical protein
MNMSQSVRLAVRFAAALAVAILVANSSSVALAHGAGGDIGLWSITTPGGEKVDVGFAELDDDDIHHIFFDRSDSVFNNILIPHTPTVLPPIPWTLGTAEPGFDANEGELTPLKPIFFNLENFQYWDGTGAVNFGSLPAGLSGGYAPQPNLSFADGGHHSHPVFGIVGGGTPNGVYLSKIVVSIDTMIDSDPYYKVSLVDQDLYTGDENMDAANAEALGELVRAYLEDPVNNPEPVFNGKNYRFYADAIPYAETLPVPEPTAFALITTALLGAFTVRRRTL